MEAPRVGRAACEPLAVYPGSQRQVSADWCRGDPVCVLTMVDMIMIQQRFSLPKSRRVGQKFGDWQHYLAEQRQGIVGLDHRNHRRR